VKESNPIESAVYFSTEKEVEVFGTEDIENAPRSEKF
jgi:hypothetical protein